MFHFKLPDFEQCLRLWRDNFEGKAFRLADDVDLARLAREHELSGGSTINVLRFACLEAVVRESGVIFGGVFEILQMGL